MQLLYARQVSCRGAAGLSLCAAQRTATLASHALGTSRRSQPTSASLARRWYAVDLRALDGKWRQAWKTSDDAPRKWVIRSDSVVPTLGINDPLLFFSLPPDLTAFTGFDALCHASETYFSPRANPHARSLDGKAIQFVAANLREAVARPVNYEARVGMMWAQYLAAIAFMSGGLGVVHAISHAVSAYYDTHHGLNCGIILPRAWADAARANPRTVAEIAALMGEETAGLSPARAADLAVEAMIRLLRDVEAPENFVSIAAYTKSRMGIGQYAEWGGTRFVGDDADIERIVTHVMEEGPIANSAHVITAARARRLVAASMREPL